MTFVTDKSTCLGRSMVDLRIYVSTKAIRRESVELASLMKKERKKEIKEKIQFLPSSGLGCGRSLFLKVFTRIPIENHSRFQWQELESLKVNLE